MIIIKTSSIQFKNPQIGQPTRAIEDHYNGRRISADINGEEKSFRFTELEMPFNTDEDGMIALIEKELAREDK